LLLLFEKVGVHFWVVLVFVLVSFSDRKTSLENYETCAGLWDRNHQHFEYLEENVTMVLVKTYVKIKIFKVYQEILIKIISDIMGNMDFFVFPTKKK